MMVGAVPFVAAGLALLREWLGERGLEIIPNIDARPEALLGGATVLFLGAYARRRLRTSSQRPNEELKPTAAQSSLVE